MKHEANLIQTRNLNGGVQHVFKFSNNYGASVVKHDFSYGGRDGFWELAVIYFNENDDKEPWDLTYNTPITNDVLGWLTWENVEKKLDAIEKLGAST